MRFSALFVLASLAVTSFGLDIEVINTLKDLRNLEHKYAQLDDEFDWNDYDSHHKYDFPAEIHDYSVAVVESIDQAASDMQAVIISNFIDDGGPIILERLVKLGATTESTLEQFTMHYGDLTAPSFRRGIARAVNFGNPTVKSDLSRMKSSTNEMYSRFIQVAAATPKVGAETEAIKERLNRAFDAVINLY